MGLLSVAEALEAIQEAAAGRRTPREDRDLARAAGCSLAADVEALTTSPAADVSAMDGYAVRSWEAGVGARLDIIGESRAGAPFFGALPQGAAVRIFTGAHVPAGADAILIQENAVREGSSLLPQQATQPGASIRAAGRDFRTGDVLLRAGDRLSPFRIALAAAGGCARLPVHRPPRIGVLANGDELVAAGEDPGEGRQVNSITPALMALLSSWGADTLDLGVARDEEQDVRTRIASAEADILVPVGGASVGDYDVVRGAFAAEGFHEIFAKVAVKPGKPTWFAARGHTLALGLPGNPSSALVCAHVFLRPLIDALISARREARFIAARSAAALPPAGPREEYLRAGLTRGDNGELIATAAADQDSSLLTPWRNAGALIRRPPGAPAVAAGGRIDILLLA